jgi:xanthine dehydrogenase accessory factor
MQEWIKQLYQLHLDGVPAAMVTVAKTSGSTPRTVGTKMLVTSSGLHSGTIGGGELEEIALREAMEALRSGELSRMIEVPLSEKAGQCCGGALSLLIEVIATGTPLIIFGGGHVGSAICQILKGTQFNVTIIDSREDWPKVDLLPPNAQSISYNQRLELYAKIEWEKSYVLVLTHSHRMDQDILVELADRPLKYLGMIGSETKWARFQSRMRELGVSQEKLDQIHCPIGLPIGGKSPQEVAISIAAQLLAIDNEQSDRVTC